MKIKIKWPLKSILYVVLGSILGPYITGAITVLIVRLCGFPIETVEGFNVYELTAGCSTFFILPVFFALFTVEKDRLQLDALVKKIDENKKRIKEQLESYTYYRTLEEVDGIENLVDN
jgi:hypothetical protein